MPYIILSSWLLVCQKLSNLVEFDEVLTKKVGPFFGTPCMYTLCIYKPTL